jgi:hypothetical protein
VAEKMKLCKRCFAEKNESQFYADKKAADGLFSYCKDCQKSYRLEYYKNNQDIEKQKFKEYRDSNPEATKLSKHNYYKVNKSTYNARTRKRQAAKLQRTPAWLTDGSIFEMECIYKYCSALRSVGLDYEVDHVFPLQGKHVSGLHVPENLQVILASENRSKHNNVGTKNEQ